MENNDLVEEFDDELLSLINWDELLDDLPGSDNLLTSQADFSNSSPETMSSWIGEIENLIMNDDTEKVDDVAPDFIAGVLVDSPPDGFGEVVDTLNDKDSVASDDLKAEVDPVKKNFEEDIRDDPISKKLRRQLRNRDAAVRSRERKKMHMKDLEMKSKFWEAECRRLGRLVHCLAAENNALRFGAALGVTSTKQESAVLLLESLLLGSLLWFLGIMCLFNLASMPPSTPLEIPIGNGEEKVRQKLLLRGARSKMWVSAARSRRCKASKTRMKARFSVLA